MKRKILYEEHAPSLYHHASRTILNMAIFSICQKRSCFLEKLLIKGNSVVFLSMTSTCSRHESTMRTGAGLTYACGIYMNTSQPHHGPEIQMTDGEFELLSGFIRAHCGIKMSASKKIMLESRLQKRLRALGISSFREYCSILFHSPEGPFELVHMIDSVTTNKTEFFREPSHFEFLTETALPEYVGIGEHAGKSGYAVLSAGCSTGEEPYSLAIVLNEFTSRNPGFQFTLTAVDISAATLKKAQAGIYHQSQVTMIPTTLRQKYFMVSKDRNMELVRIVPEVRDLVRFLRMNLMDECSLPSKGTLDAIFCRNVIIYFDRETQYRLLRCFCRSLKTGAHLFLGHSETVHGFDLPLVRKRSTIYRKEP
jgi:chemotaxis protein methyltransferase CheR